MQVTESSVTQPIKKSHLRFAKAFASAVRRSDEPRKTSHIVAVIAVIAVFGFAAVIAGAITAHTPSASGSGNSGKPGHLLPTSPAASKSPSPTASRAPAANGKPAAGSPPSQPGVLAAPAAAAPQSPEARTSPKPAARAKASASAKSVATSKARTSPKASASAKASASPRAAASASSTFEVTGQVDCTSGAAVVGFWVQASVGSGWASWKWANTDNYDYWLALPKNEPYKMSIGCGGSTKSWAVATYTPQVTGWHNSFHCDNIAGQADFGRCVLR
jgi:hypothetical protein